MRKKLSVCAVWTKKKSNKGAESEEEPILMFPCVCSSSSEIPRAGEKEKRNGASFRDRSARDLPAAVEKKKKRRGREREQRASNRAVR